MTDDEGHKMMTIPHMDIWPWWAKNWTATKDTYVDKQNFMLCSCYIYISFITENISYFWLLGVSI